MAGAVTTDNLDSNKGEAPKPGEIPADKAKAMAEAVKNTVTRATVSSESGEKGKEATKGEASTRPEWLPEKFKTPEDFAKAYGELEKKLGGNTKPAVEPPKPGTPESLKIGDKPVATPEEAVAKAGLDMKALNEEYAQKGELSAESLKKLEATGISKTDVDAYIEGQKALIAQRVSEIESVAGSHEQFDRMREWSAANLPEAEKLAINKVIETGDHNAIKLAFQGVHAKWTAAGQNEPMGQIRGGKQEPSMGDVYKFRSEMIADMKKPEYNKSEAFRAAVQAKVARSNIF